MKKKLFSFFAGTLMIISCTKNTGTNPPPPPPPVQTLYFPPLTGAEWQTSSTASLNWNDALLTDLNSFLQQKNSKAFIILKNGKIAVEWYFGTFTADSNHYWASAGKTMTAMLVGIAKREGLLSLSHKTSQYIGTGWTSLPLAKENLISIRHQLTMTSGLDDGVPDTDCTQPSCLQYIADAGTRWAYHNAVYTLLDQVLESATGRSFNNYFQEKIRNRIGMNGLWLRTGPYNNIYYSTARSMARFGLLLLNKGTWNQDAILGDSLYFNEQINSSQSLNPSYGYLTWLGGKTSHMLPGLQFVFQGSIAPNAPADMFAALGKNDQKVYVVPSQGLVVIRMGDSAGNSHLAVSGFDNELWGKLKPILGY